MIQVRLNGVPAIDSLGRRAHVRGIYCHAWLEATLAAANSELSAYNLRSIFPSITMKDVQGWSYLQDVQARTILDDQYFRFGKQLQFNPLKAGVQDIGGQGSEVLEDAGFTLNEGAGVVVKDVS